MLNGCGISSATANSTSGTGTTVDDREMVDMKKEEKSDNCMNNPLYQELLKDRNEKEQALQMMQQELNEISEYASKLEANYNQCLEYITHLESILAEVFLVVFFLNSSVKSVRKQESCC